MKAPNSRSFLKKKSQLCFCYQIFKSEPVFLNSQILRNRGDTLLITQIAKYMEYSKKRKKILNIQINPNIYTFFHVPNRSEFQLLKLA